MRNAAITITWCVVTLFTAFPAQAAESIFLPDSNGCGVFDPSPLEGEIVTWSGACKDGLADGLGKVEWINTGKVSSTEEGMFRGGKRNGHAVIHYSSGTIYDGEFADGEYQGHGVLISPDGARREGEFDHGSLQFSSDMNLWYANLKQRLNDSLHHARGPIAAGSVVIVAHLDANKKITSWQVMNKSTSEDLDAYIVDGANRIGDLPAVPTKDDVVTLSYRYMPTASRVVIVVDPPIAKSSVVMLDADASGCQAESPRPNPGKTITWTGACKEKLLDGPGVLAWSDAGNTAYSIEATFVRGQAQGKAVVSFPDKRRYEGELTHNSLTGFGVLSDAEGNRYQGDLAEGKFQGQGKIVYADHSTYAGGWYNDMRVGAGDFVDSDGSRFQGNYVNNARVGYGIFDPHGRVRYAGRFLNDKPVDPISHASRYAGVEPSLVEYTPVNLRVESYKTYRQLNREEKATVDAQYPKLAQGDEPPYPSRGLLPIYHELLRLESLSLLSGAFSIIADVDASGQVTKVDVLESPDDELSKQAIDFVLRQQFKPAVCQQSACGMPFPLKVNLGH